VQYLSTGKQKDCQEQQGHSDQDKQDLSTYRYSDEIRKTAVVVQHKQIRGNYYDKVNFTDSRDGFGELQFKKGRYSKIQHICPPDIATSSFGKDGFSLYQWGAAGVEKILNTQNIFIRYNVIRVVSILLGMIMLLTAYHVFKAVRFSKKQSLILTAIISFQPKLVIYFTNINYDVLLIPLWTGFILAGVIILKKGWSLSRGVVLFLLLAGAISTKPSALPLLGLVVFLIGGTFYKKFNKQKDLKRLNWLIVGAIAVVLGIGSYLLLDRVGVTTMFASRNMSMLGEYLSKSLPKIYGSSRDYWGAIRWNQGNLTLLYVKTIWVIEWLAWSGLVLWIIGPMFIEVFKNTMSKVQWKFFRQLVIGHHEKKSTLRESLATIVTTIIRRSTDHIKQLGDIVKQNDKQRKFFWFMLIAIIVLQIGIRVADWKVFVNNGTLALGTPGRYWLPNIVPHFILLAMGLKVVTGLVRSKKTREKYFEFSLLLFLVIMILYWVYEVIGIIIPRYYL
jgi:hypothetical protein